MTDLRWARVTEILERAAALAAADRRAYLDGACAGDPDLRRHVDVLIAADERAESFLVAPEALRTPGFLELGTAYQTEGTRVGSYTIRRRIATGGMGSVYEAEQIQPRRTVALKLVNPGTAAPGTLARFAFEAEALGRLTHASIAKVYEAGTDEHGRAFLAMEYVEDARHVNEYVRAHGLGTRAVLDLFLRVCDGVAHGHEKGVIHRDLKPSNILVNAAGEPKVIDFGVARLVDDSAAQITRAGEIVGTLLYMSPEQLEGRAAEVDVRSDVYALGCVLYELVSGRTPHDLKDVSLTEAARRIRDDVPTPLRALAPAIDADLGWIAAKAIEKDRERRYAGVAEFASDLRRYLGHEPVLAGPPTTSYRLRKFVRRHRFGTGVAISALVVLVGGLVAAVLARAHALELLSRATAAEKVADERALLVQKELTAKREIAALQASWLRTDQLDIAGRDVRLADVLDHAARAVDRRDSLDPDVEAPLREALARAYFQLNLWDEAREQMRQLHTAIDSGGAIDLEDLDEIERAETTAEGAAGNVDRSLELATTGLERALGEHGAEALPTARWRAMRGSALLRCHRGVEAEDELRAAIAVLVARIGANALETLDARVSLVRALDYQRKRDEALPAVEQVLVDARAAFGDSHATTLLAWSQAANQWWRSGAFDRAADAYAELLPIHEARFGPSSSATLKIVSDLGWVQKQRGELAAAEQLLRRAVDIARGLEGTSGGGGAIDLARLGAVIVALGRSDEGVATLTEALETSRAHMGADHDEPLDIAGSLGRQLRGLGRMDEAEALLADTLERSTRKHGADHPRTLARKADYAAIVFDRGAPAEAAGLYRDVLELQEARLPADGADVLLSLRNLAEAQRVSGEFGEAECWTTELRRRQIARFGASSPAAWGHATILASVLDRTDRAAESASDLSLAIAAHESAERRDPAALVTLLCARSRSCRAGEDDAGARADAEEAVVVALTELPEGHVLHAFAEARYGILLGELGEHAAAVEFLEASLTRGAPGAGETVDVYEGLARSYEALGRVELAAAARARAANPSR